MNNPRPLLFAALSFFAPLVGSAAIITNADLGLPGIVSAEGVTDGNHGSEYVYRDFAGVEWNIDGTDLHEATLSNLGASGTMDAVSLPTQIIVSKGGFLGDRSPFEVRTDPLYGYDNRLLGLGLGALVGEEGSFSRSSGLARSSWNLGAPPTNRTANLVSGESAYIGFRFLPSVNSPYHYGWAEVTLTLTGTYGEFTIHRWAYENSGAPIAAGQTVAIPEPTSLGECCAVSSLIVSLGCRRRREDRPALGVRSVAS